MPRAIANWIQLIPGYMQTLGDAQQGVPALWHKLYASHRVRACVQMHPWNTNWSDVAEQIFRCSRNGQPPRIMLVAYSWGVGFGAVNFLRELRRRNLHVEAAIFSDGVYHLGGQFFHRIGCSQVSAYLTRPWGRPNIRIPQNITEVHWFTQNRKNFELNDRMTWLRGHELVWDKDPTTNNQTGMPLPNKTVVDGVLHRHMDELDSFNDKVNEVANRLFRPNFIHD